MNRSRAIRLVASSAVVMVAIMLALAAFSHRILPAEVDECQRDISHAGHVAELPPFHCIGHSEWDTAEDTWDHRHPWMTRQWHVQHGIDESHAE